MNRPKIFYNIDESTFVFYTENFAFYFSSVFYMNKFMEEYEKNRKHLEYKFTARFCITFDASDYCDIILYSNIEKRGFKLIKLSTGRIYRNLNDIKLVSIMCDKEFKTPDLNSKKG